MKKLDAFDQYTISPEELKALQEVHISLLMEVDRICKLCGIRYNMVGGTMLGAIRHRGFIPWDDDADIGLLRSEYERFREACRTELDNERFYFQDFRDTPGYRWGYGKLRRRNTRFVRHNQEFMPYEQGVFIDLMPFDCVPDGLWARRYHMLKCFVFRKIFWSEVGRFADKNPVKRFCYSVINRIPFSTVSHWYQSFIDSCDRLQTNMVRILTFPTPKNVFGYDKRWYTDLSMYEFEHIQLPGARDYDGYLRVKFGDYMTLPPEAKRKVHPVSIFSLLEDDLDGDKEI